MNEYQKAIYLLWPCLLRVLAFSDNILCGGRVRVDLDETRTKILLYAK